MAIEDSRGLGQEELIVEVTEALARALAASGLAKSELAARLGKTKGFVSQVLGGGRNLTLRTLADFAGAIGCRVRVDLSPRAEATPRARAATLPAARPAQSVPSERPAAPATAAPAIGGGSGSK
ncbi:MAG TPA: helix-turn-helix transcriptional regulator [Thermoanaerobaculia bacterium]|jgi:transcriptional regulator with XRE-family HTH domain|nr:helix-turn-helix transcriptional regulator [Thermoanaerobaculia bacterium]